MPLLLAALLPFQVASFLNDAALLSTIALPGRQEGALLAAASVAIILALLLVLWAQYRWARSSRAMQKEARDSEKRYRELIDALPVMVYSVEPVPPYRPLYLSRGHDVLGYSREEWMASESLWLRALHPDDRARVLAQTARAVEQREPLDFEYRAIDKSGAVRWLRDRGRFVFGADGKPTAWQGYMLDVTERKQLQDELRQAHKMEAVGRLAGGIAHDFNNLLNVIGSYAALVLADTPAGTPQHTDLTEIGQAVRRGAALTRQLLTFSRYETPELTQLEVDAVIRDAERMVRRLLGPEIELKLSLDTCGAHVRMGGGHLDQILVNLLVNSADAMPQGGRITISTQRVHAGVGGLTDPQLAPGEYVRVEVRDSGAGMDAATAARAIDPFFTTKEVGHGTGLGLSTVYGIATQAGGGVSIRSKVGEGTSVSVFLPCGEAAAALAEAGPAAPAAEAERGQRILLVDDEESVRRALARFLEREGYTVVTAADGAEALRAWMAHAGDFDLLVTDIRMPGMSGYDLIARVRELAPNVRVIAMSGFPEDHSLRPNGVRAAPERFVDKPFGLHDVLAAVRGVLREARAPDAR